MSTLTVLIVIFVVTLLWYTLSLLLWAIRAAKMTANIGGPKPLPIIGNLLYFADMKDLNDGAERLLKLFKIYFQQPDRICKFWLGPMLLIGVANPQHVQTVLSGEYTQNKVLMYSHLNILMNGLVGANGKKWAELRKMINPFMPRKAVEPYLDNFNEKAMKLVKFIDSKVDNDQQFNIKHFIDRCTRDMLIVSMYGCDINETENDKRPEPLDEVFESTVVRIFKLCVRFPSCLSVSYSERTSLGREVKEKAKIFWQFLGEVFESRKKQLDRNGGSRRVYADLIIEKALKDNLTWEQTGRLGTDFLLGGSHSVSIMASSLILMLAMYPEYQEAVYQEQVEILGDDPEVEPTWEQLSQMTYLARVFKEIIRLFTGPMITRQAIEDVDLGKFIIPKGSYVVISLHSLHRDPTVWSHPEGFYPDHFLPEESDKRPKSSYLPYSWGPRNCPGGLYAMIVVKTIVSALVRKFHFKTDLKYEELTFKLSLFLDIHQGQIVKKVPRKQ